MSNIYKPKIFEFTDLKSLASNLVIQIEQSIIESEAENGLSRLLVEGDTSLKDFFELMVSSPIIAWQNVEIYQSDQNSVKSVKDGAADKTTYLYEHFINPLDGNFKDVFSINSGDGSQGIEGYFNDIYDNLDGVFFENSIVNINNNGTIGGVNTSIIKKNDGDLHFVNTGESIGVTINTLLNSKEISIVLDTETSREVLFELLEGSKSIEQFPAKAIFSHPNVNVYFVNS